MRECASRLRELAKSTGIAVFVIGHVTKEGIIAGPRVLEHIVDTVLYLEGDRFQSYRLLRSVKNRFGATSEVGVFEMRERGMVEVTNPSEAFLAERMVNAAGLGDRGDHGRHAPAAGGDPGADQPHQPRQPAPHPQRGRLQPPAADRRGADAGAWGCTWASRTSSSTWSAVCASTSRPPTWRWPWRSPPPCKDQPVQADTVLIGEVGLSGELRMVGQMHARLREAAKLGFRQAIVPRRVAGGEPWPEGIRIAEARSLNEALLLALVQSAA